MLALRAISKGRILIEPLHVDKLGGLSPVGYYAIGTTLLFSSGSLFLPFIAEAVIVSRGQLNDLILFGMFIYSLFILLSFLYPTTVIHQTAKKESNAKGWRISLAIPGFSKSTFTQYAIGKLTPNTQTFLYGSRILPYRFHNFWATISLIGRQGFFESQP